MFWVGAVVVLDENDGGLLEDFEWVLVRLMCLKCDG